MEWKEDILLINGVRKYRLQNMQSGLFVFWKLHEKLQEQMLTISKSFSVLQSILICEEAASLIESMGNS